jgi:predicted HAD superfamily Cof-like phosphohydrolase
MHSPRDRLLDDSRQHFQLYAREHRSKAHRFEKARLGCSDEVECARLLKEEESSIQKAKTNEQMVELITKQLLEPTENVLYRTAEFGEIVNPDGFTPTSRQSQLGVHFEEVAEMCVTFKSSNEKIQDAIDGAWAANQLLADLLKTTSSQPTVKVLDRLEFIDSIADQLVTGTLTAVQYHMKPVEALAEVNRSNYSKLTDGVMALDPQTNKWIKGPNYKPPRLNPYI